MPRRHGQAIRQCHAFGTSINININENSARCAACGGHGDGGLRGACQTQQPGTVGICTYGSFASDASYPCALPPAILEMLIRVPRLCRYWHSGTRSRASSSLRPGLLIANASSLGLRTKGTRASYSRPFRKKKGSKCHKPTSADFHRRPRLWNSDFQQGLRPAGDWESAPGRRVWRGARAVGPVACACTVRGRTDITLEA
ncbi:hypothetical protein C8Q77DRAFT_842212 [Trametes polyzona]|nr:hypothetical protein C8Q77DRAFT_842212 [Trametes polyzona]